MSYDLSVLIPARNELFLERTVDDVLANSSERTEIIVVLDGDWPASPMEQKDRVKVYYTHDSIGQRAATNMAARLSNAKWIMKLDAHCSVDKDFDTKLMAECEYDWTVIPRQYNLHAFDWMCDKCGHRTYQGPTPKACEKCRSIQLHREMVWQRRMSRQTTAWRFDSNLHFQYFGEYSKRPEHKGKKFTPTMSCLGACWFLHRDRYWELGGLDESHGSWGQMGTELACKSWLSGGQMLVNHDTWFAHMFRTQGGDFSFPYPISGSDQEKARKHSKKLWLDGTWPKAKHPLSWLIKKFAPVPDWPDEPEMKAPEQLTKGVVYYTDNRLEETIDKTVRHQIKRSLNGHKLVSVSLKPMLDFGRNYMLQRERGYLTMFKQILYGLEKCEADIIFFCEHDVLYHPSHFDFIPPRRDVFYYNVNTYKVDSETGQALFYYTDQTSGLCAYRGLLIEHYQKRITKVEQNAADLRARGEKVKNDGYSRHMGFEPGKHRFPRGVDNYKAERWMSEFPNVDIRHNANLTPSRWREDQFRNPDACLGWKLSDEVPGWGKTKDRFWEFLAEVQNGKQA